MNTTLEYMGESIVQGVHIPLGKVIVFGSMPLLDNIRNLSLADRTILVGTNYEVMGLLIAKLIFLVRLDALLVTRPSLGHLAKSPCDNLREIIKNVLGMPTSESHFVGKDKVGANERCVAHAQTCGKALVVRVAKTKDRASIIIVSFSSLDVEQAEVALTKAMKRMVGIYNFPSVVLDLVLHSINEKRVTDWSPRLGCFGSFYRLDFAEVNLLCATY
jgi:hypothetical protein